MFQNIYLVKEKSESSDSGVLYVDLPKNELISMIMVEFNVYNTAATSRDDDRSVLDVLKNVTVLLEGSKTAFSMHPEVASYAAFLAQGVVPDHNIRERGKTSLRLPIYFGRYPGDLEYMLNTGNYQSAQLQLEYELNTTYETTGTTSYTVWYQRPMNTVSPRGFIRSRTVELYNTTGSAESKQINLPTGLPWYSVFFRVWDIDQFVLNNLTDLDFNIGQGIMHLFDGRFEDLQYLNKQWLGSMIEANKYWAMAYSGLYVQHLMADPAVINWSHYAAGAYMYASSAIWSNRHQITVVDPDGAATSTERDFMVSAKGGFPYSCFLVGNFREEPFTVPSGKDAFIQFELGAYSAELEVCVQEVVAGRL